MSDDVITFKRYVGAFNNVSRISFGTDYKNGEVGVANGTFYGLVAVANQFISVNLSSDGDVSVLLAPDGQEQYPQMFIDPPSSLLEDDVVQNVAVQVAAEIADLEDIRELHFGSEFWPSISKNGINLPPGWDFTNSTGGEIHLERG